MAGSYTLELELFGVYTSNMPSLEIWEDGSLNSTHLVSSAGTTISVTINYGGALPTSLAFTFNDGFAANGRTIEIRSVRIDNQSVSVGNYLSTDSLTKSATATVSVVAPVFLFDDSDPALSEFTTGATRTMTAGNDTMRDFAGTTDEIFDALGGRDVLYLGSGNDKVFGNDGDDIIYAGGGNDLISGGNGNDNIYGGLGNDRLYGGDGNDRIHGEDGDDEIYGGAGDDTLNGHAGADLIVGGAGADKINGGDDNDILYGGAGDDQIVGGNGNDTIDGGDGDDLVYGGAGIDYIDGGAGNDYLIGNDGADVINGGADNDVILGGADNDDLYGGTGNDDIYGGDGNDVLIGGPGSGVKAAAMEPLVDASTVITYGGGQDVSGTVTYLSSGMTLDGNLWKKILINYTVTANTVIEFDFKSTLESEISGIGFDNDSNIDDGATFKVYGTQAWGISAFDNYDGSGDWNHYQINVGAYYTGTFSHLVFANDHDSGPTGNGSWSNLIIYETTDAGSFDNDDLYGGAGNDTLDGGGGRDNLYGGADNDTINGGAGADTLVGGTGVDIMDGGADNDTFLLANGDFAAGESITGGIGTDNITFTDATIIDFTTGTLATINTLNGSTGNDDVTYTIQQALGFNTINLGGGTDTSRVQISGTVDITVMTTPTISNVENGFLIGSAGNDTLTISGTQLNALIIGSGTINFDAGTDTLNITSTSTGLNTLGATNTSIQGLETISASTAAAGVTINMSAQTEALTLTGSASADIITGGSDADIIDGGLGDDTIYGNDGDDIINGGTTSGSDIIYGGNGNDNISGGGNSDNLYGESGDDILDGGNGSDFLTGGIGVDTMTGGQGDDRFYLANGDFGTGETIDGGAETDNITLTNATTVDFTTGTLATIETLNGSTGSDTVTMTGTQLNSFTTLSFNGGTDALNITSTSTGFNALSNGAVTGLEEISAATAGAGVTLSVSSQTENFTLIGGGFNDVITGGSGNDTITGGAGNDTLNGGNGNDIITGGNGNDTINGGAGTDTVIFSADWNFYTITLSAGIYTIVHKNSGINGTDTATLIENFQFADGTLTTANLLAPTITSNGAGATATVSRAENGTSVTTVTATNPNPSGAALTYSISGGADAGKFAINATTGVLAFASAPDYEVPTDNGADNIYDVQVRASDGTHYDTQNIAVSVTNVVETDVGSTPGTAGTLVIGSSVLYDVGSSGDRDWFAVTLTSGTKYAFWARGTPSEAASSSDPRIYNLYEADGTTSVGSDDDGGIGYESLLYYTATYTGTYYIDAGAYGSNTGQILLSAFVGGSTQNGGTGADTLTGSAYADYLVGNNGNDTLNGNAGSDILEGGNNDDILNGGTGADVLFGGSGADIFRLWDTDALDSIVDFTTGQGDALDISNILVGWNAGTDDIDDYVQFQTVGSNTIMRVDVDGLANGTNYVEIAKLLGNTGEIVQTLYDNGDIIT